MGKPHGSRVAPACKGTDDLEASVDRSARKAGPAPMPPRPTVSVDGSVVSVDRERSVRRPQTGAMSMLPSRYSGLPHNMLAGQSRQPWQVAAIHPRDARYKVFWYVTIVAALANAFIEPYKLAFTNDIHFGPDTVFWTTFEVVGTLIFFIDIVLKFFVAYKDPDGTAMVTDLRLIRLRYLKGMFIPDVLFMFPFVPVILGACPGLIHTKEGLYVGLIGLLKLGRLYNLAELFSYLDYQMVLGQASLMLLRNLTYIMLACHLFACIFYYIARVNDFSESSWVGAAYDRFDDQPAHVLYMNSMYLSIVTYSGLGDSAMYAHNPVETLFMSLFCLLNVFMAAYVLGTVTMLMVKGDEQSGIFRGHMSMLKQYSRVHNLPEELEQGMQQHLELHFLGDISSDEKLLATYPSAIKRRVLRHLYEEPLRSCYLFTGLKAKFLDALMASCRTDLFLPHVQLVSEGDIVSDLYMVVEGQVEVISGYEESQSGKASSVFEGSAHGTDTEPSVRGREASFVDRTQRTNIHSRRGSVTLGDMSARVGSVSAKGQRTMVRRAVRTMRSMSDTFGAVAFFTETPSTEAIWTLTVVKVLMISRATYEALTSTHPRQVQTILSNLKAYYEKELLEALQNEIEALDDCSVVEWLKPYMDDGELTTTDLPPLVMMNLKNQLTPAKAQLVDQLDMIKTLINTYLTRKDQQRTIELLDAASKGDDETIKRMLAAGVSPNKCDYDKRTPLMVAAQEGKENVVKMLVEAGADVDALDIFGTNALVGAVKAGHTKAIETLLKHGASLAKCSQIVRPEVIDCIIHGDMSMLSRYLNAGTDPNMCDHNKSTLLHVAAAEGSITACKILLASGADVLLKDRWGNRAVDDARRVEAMPVVKLLEPMIAEAKRHVANSSPTRTHGSGSGSGGGGGGDGGGSGSGSDAEDLLACSRKLLGRYSSMNSSSGQHQARGAGGGTGSQLPSSQASMDLDVSLIAEDVRLRAPGAVPPAGRDDGTGTDRGVAGWVDAAARGEAGRSSKFKMEVKPSSSPARKVWPGVDDSAHGLLAAATELGIGGGGGSRGGGGGGGLRTVRSSEGLLMGGGEADAKLMLQLPGGAVVDRKLSMKAAAAARAAGNTAAGEAAKGAAGGGAAPAPTTPAATAVAAAAARGSVGGEGGAVVAAVTAGIQRCPSPPSLQHLPDSVATPGSSGAGGGASSGGFGGAGRSVSGGFGGSVSGGVGGAPLHGGASAAVARVPSCPQPGGLSPAPSAGAAGLPAPFAGSGSNSNSNSGFGPAQGAGPETSHTPVECLSDQSLQQMLDEVADGKRPSPP